MGMFQGDILTTHIIQHNIAIMNGLNYILNNELVKYLFNVVLPKVNLHVERRKEVVKFELSDLLWCIQFCAPM